MSNHSPQPTSENAPEKAVVLLSGGLDSTVAMADAHTRYQVAHAITFDYGQKAFKAEMKASKALAEHYGLPYQVIGLHWLESLLPKDLSMRKYNTPNRPAPEYPEGTPETTARVWVPNRNGVFLNIAAAFAEAHEATVVVFGANADEAGGFPDNTQEYRERLNGALEYSTLNHVRVETPVGVMRKTEIIERAAALEVPLNLIWSCYGPGPVHCGQCTSCQLLKESLARASHPYQIRFAA